MLEASIKNDGGIKDGLKVSADDLVGHCVELSHVRVSSTMRQSILEAMACSPLSSDGGKKQDPQKGRGGSFTSGKQPTGVDHHIAIVALVCHLAPQPVHLTSSPLAASSTPPPSLEADSSRRLGVNGESTSFPT
jgi:hypothetical protein